MLLGRRWFALRIRGTAGLDWGTALGVNGLNSHNNSMALGIPMHLTGHTPPGVMQIRKRYSK